MTSRWLKMAHWTLLWLFTAVLLPGDIDAATLSVSGSTQTAVASATEISLKCKYTLSANETATKLTWMDPSGAAILTWTFPGTPPTKSHWTAKFSGTTATATLDPPHVIKTSGGTYKCQFVSSLGTTNATRSVTVQYKPTVTLNHAGSYDVNENTRLLLTCTASAAPAAKVQWKKGSTILSGTSVKKDKAVRGDAGTYTCTATNTMINGTGSATATVAVTINYLDTPQMTVTNTTVKENQRVTISCSVTSVPTPTLTISGPVTSGRTAKGSTTANITFSAQCLDAGSYKCLATNAKLSSSQVVTKTLRVLCKPREQPSSQKNVTKKVNESALFSASIIADPLPQFTWSRRDPDTGLVTEIQNNSGHFEIINNDKTSSLNVTVKNADDYTEYILKVKNGEGAATLNYWLRSQTAPFRVKTLKSANTTTDSITVCWTSAFNGGAGQNYSLQYQTMADRESGVWTQKVSEIEDPGRKKLVYATVSDIHPGRTYTFRIFSKNALGNSVYSNYINITTSDLPQQLSVGAGIGIGIAISILLLAVIVGCLLLYVKMIRPWRHGEMGNSLKTNNPEYDPQSVGNPDSSHYTHLEINTRETNSPETYDDLHGDSVYQNVPRSQNNPQGPVSPEVYMNVTGFKEAEQEPKNKDQKKKNKKGKKSKSKERPEAYENTAPGEDLYANS